MSIFWSMYHTKKTKKTGHRVIGRASWKSRTARIHLWSLTWECIEYEGIQCFDSWINLLIETILHEELHLFFKFIIGKYMNAEETAIRPLAYLLRRSLFYENRSFFMELYSLFQEVDEFMFKKQVEAIT